MKSTISDLHFVQVSSEYIEVRTGDKAFDVFNIFDYETGTTKEDYNFVTECNDYLNTHTVKELVEMIQYS